MRALGVAVMLLVESSGCAWLLQDAVPDRYDASTARAEPSCSDSAGWSVVDVIFSISSAATAMLALADPEMPYRSVYIGSGLGWTVIHGASAYSGHKWAGECRKAIADWNAASGDSNEEQRRSVRREIEREERAQQVAEERAEERAEAKRRQEKRTPVPRPGLRGFFCASSPTATSSGLCTRQKVDCSRARSAAVVAILDLSECTLVENAYCFDAGSGDPEERCAPSEEACFAQQRATSGAGECVVQN